MVDVVNGSFASPAASLDYPTLAPVNGGVLSSIYNGMNGPSVVATLLLLLIAYDQCK